MSSDTIYAGAGIAGMSVGFSILVASIAKQNTSLEISSIVLIAFGVVMSLLAYIGAKRSESRERKIKLIEYNNAVKTINELSKVNENINILINEIREERKGRNKNKNKQIE